MEGDISMNRENAWTTYEEADIKALEGLCKDTRFLIQWKDRT